jgi:predicted dehydrogenase
MLKVAIVGCGKIADAHALQIQRIADCVIVGVCDQEELMARQLQERFGIQRSFCDLTSLLREARPDVIHVTTPPQSHYAITRQCLEAGCHVYVEKPFTLYTAEAEELVALADQKGLRLTAGHDEQFSHAMQRMRQQARSGYLGGTPVHMESTWCYELGEGAYASALFGDKNHWVRKLPGRLLHNLLSHGIAKIAEYLAGDRPAVQVVGFPSRFLEKNGETELVDELRVIITDENNTTAYFTLSTQMRPLLHQFRVFGPKNGLLMDEDQQTLIKIRGQRYKSYGEKFIPPLTLAGQQLSNFFRNTRLFLGNDFHLDAGKKYLIEAFYRSIAVGDPVPIPYAEILRTSRIMDAIFQQIAARNPPVSAPPSLAPALVAAP